MHGRQNSVNESRKAEGGMVDVENGGGGTAFHDASDGKHPKEGESEQPAPGSHPVKGKILDIRGS
jgi:hypothetical protein